MPKNGNIIKLKSKINIPGARLDGVAALLIIDQHKSKYGNSKWMENSNITRN